MGTVNIPTIIYPTSGTSLPEHTSTVILWGQNTGYEPSPSYPPSANIVFIGEGKLVFMGTGKIYIN